MRFNSAILWLWVPAFAGTTAENLARSRGYPGLSRVMTVRCLRCEPGAIPVICEARSAAAIHGPAYEERWIASSRRLSSRARSRDPLAPRNDGVEASSETYPHRRPGEGRDPLPQLLIVAGRWGHHPVHHQARWLWVPAFAGTTNRESRSPHPPRSMGPGLRRDDDAGWSFTSFRSWAAGRFKRPLEPVVRATLCRPDLLWWPFGSQAANMIIP